MHETNTVAPSAISWEIDEIDPRRKVCRSQRQSIVQLPLISDCRVVYFWQLQLADIIRASRRAKVRRRSCHHLNKNKDKKVNKFNKHVEIQNCDDPSR